MKNFFNKCFELRGTFEPATVRIIQIVGFVILLLIWHLYASSINNIALFPTPWQVLKSYKSLLLDYRILPNAWFSIKLNFLGLIEAIAIAVPIGFILGLFPIFKYASKPYINAMRYIPLSAVVGLFILYFGIGVTMKVQFLSFAIIVYLIPTVILRVSEVKTEFEWTAYTMGATKWQIIKKVYIPDVMSRVFDDIITLVAISWTYIIIAELINQTGGIGVITYLTQRQGRLDRAFGSLFLIMFIGFLQDIILELFNRILFPSKYNKSVWKAITGFLENIFLTKTTAHA